MAWNPRIPGSLFSGFLIDIVPSAGPNVGPISHDSFIRVVIRVVNWTDTTDGRVLAVFTLFRKNVFL